jgi:hypothetical protein
MAALDDDDPYHILGLSRDATFTELEEAHRRLTSLNAGQPKTLSRLNDA